VYSMKDICDVCGQEYDEEEKGLKWEHLPDDFEYELYGVCKDQFATEE